MAVIHPWLPQYRQKFFGELIDAGRNRQIEFDIFYGATPPEWQQRGDSVQMPGCTELSTRHYRVGSRTFSSKSIGQLRPYRDYDLIIVEHAIRNIETYKLLASIRSRRRVAMWGHGKNYTVQRSKLEERLKLHLTRRSKWFFAYTAGGARYLEGKGYPGSRVTVVNNALDTRSISTSVRKIRTDSLSAVREKLGLSGPTALYIGGIDEAKRIDFLLAAVRIVQEQIPDFRLLIAGDGSGRDKLLKDIEGIAFVSYLGPLFGEDKLNVLAAADILAVPGRVGLVAVDSLASGTPIVTTDWDYHAPEFEYLTPGETVVVSGNSISQYATEVVDILQRAEARDLMSEACERAGAKLTVENMVANFLEGVELALEVI